jgi:hypothetical protein
MAALLPTKLDEFDDNKEWEVVWDLAATYDDAFSAQLKQIWKSGASRFSFHQSTSTGLRVIVGKIPTPVIGASFTLATEALQDNGAPHTLEHLVFMGSKEFPFKGVLDEIAKRNFSTGTNASTFPVTTELNSNIFLHYFERCRRKRNMMCPALDLMRS